MSNAVAYRMYGPAEMTAKALAEFQDLAQKYRLPPEQHELQQAMSTRQVLCIDDPMELGRSLGSLALNIDG